MGVTVKDNKKELKRLKQKMRRASKYTLKVGILASEGGADRYEDGVSILTVAGANEFGSKKAGVPERSFIRAGYDKNLSYINKRSNEIAEIITRGKRVRIKPLLNILGADIKDLIQQYATNLSTPPNAESTIKAKGSSNPLIDTRRMIKSIDFQIDK